RRRHTRFSRDWSSDVCSSDLDEMPGDGVFGQGLDFVDPFLYIVFAKIPHTQLIESVNFMRCAGLADSQQLYGVRGAVGGFQGFRSEERRVGKAGSTGRGVRRR